MLVKGNVIANDISTPLISLFKSLQSGWTPPELVTEEDYKNAKLLDDTNPLKGYIGFNMSFACKWFAGFARQVKGSKGDTKNEVICSKQGYNDVLKTKNEISHIKFENTNYYDLDIPDDSIIYCDPPYRNSTGYKVKFDHDRFYQWCLEQHDKGHEVFISEYYMPEDKFECVWSKPLKTMNPKKGMGPYAAKNQSARQQK